MRMRRDWESPAKPPKRRQRNSEGLKKERLTFRTCCPPSSAKMLFVNTAVRAVRFRNALCVSSVQLKIRLRSNAYGCASRACSSAVSCAVSCATSCESELQSRLGSSLTIREISVNHAHRSSFIFRDACALFQARIEGRAHEKR